MEKNARTKKLLACILAMVLCVCTLVSCSDGYEENGWFSDEKLSACLAPELPSVGRDYVKQGDEAIYVSFTDGEREVYVSEIYEYLASQSYAYLGTRGEMASTLAGAFTTYYFESASELSQFYVDGAYRFVYSDGTLDEYGDPIFCILSVDGCEGKNLEYGTKSFAYNTVISLQYKLEAVAGGRYVLREDKDTAGLAKVLIDYERELKEQVDKQRADSPAYEFFYYPIDRVQCTLVLSDEAYADKLMEKYDMNGIFPDADVSALNAIKMISVIFDREEFTEDVYQRLLGIRDGEELIEALYIDFERETVSTYIPKIAYYADDARKIEHEVTDALINLSDGESFVISSKAEYDGYIDRMLGLAEYDELKERINAQRDLYDAAFFEENALIVTKTLTRNSGSIKLTVNGVYVSDNKAYVVIRTDEPGVGTDNMLYVSFTVKVKKSEVAHTDEAITLE